MELSPKVKKRFENATPQVMEKFLKILIDEMILATAVYLRMFPEQYAEWVKNNQNFGDIWKDEKADAKPSEN